MLLCVNLVQFLLKTGEFSFNFPRPSIIFTSLFKTEEKTYKPNLYSYNWYIMCGIYAVCVFFWYIRKQHIGQQDFIFYNFIQP